jgi:hypothetical protein
MHRERASASKVTPNVVPIMAPADHSLEGGDGGGGGGVGGGGLEHE